MGCACARRGCGDEDKDVLVLDQRESGKYWRLQVHWPAIAQSSISCIRFDPIDGHSVVQIRSSLSLSLSLSHPTASEGICAYHSLVHSFAFTSGISPSMDKMLITNVDLPPASHKMWFLDAEGWQTHLDLRGDKTKRRAYQFSEQKTCSMGADLGSPRPY